MTTKAIYLHQFDQLGETSVAAIAATLALGGVTEVRVKTHQATTFTGHFDTSPMKLDSLAAIAQRRDQLAAAGITMRGWCVPMGLDIEAEAQLTAQVAGLFGGLIELDTEPYAGFFDGDKSGLLPFVQRLKALGVTVDVDFDARRGGYLPFGNYAAVLAGDDAVWTQSYWGTAGFGGWQATIDEALGALDSLGVPAAKRGIIFPWQGSADYAFATAYLATKGVERIAVWKMGEAGSATYSALAAIPSAAPVTVSYIPAELLQYGKTWPEVASNLLGVSSDSLAAGRKVRDLAQQIVDIWGQR